MSDTQYGMVIDLRSCTGCQTCVLSCKTSNEIAGSNFWNHVIGYNEQQLYMPVSGEKVSMNFRPTLCNHCASPLCVASCPTGAMHKNEETGIVSVDRDICIGCNSCINACPYDIPVANEDEKVAEKCNFCAGRIENGKDPYCVTACPARVRHFGIISDSNSEVSALIAENSAQVYREESGTNPSVYYILPASLE